MFEITLQEQDQKTSLNLGKILLCLVIQVTFSLPHAFH